MSLDLSLSISSLLPKGQWLLYYHANRGEKLPQRMVGVNGMFFRVSRGVNVDVPRPVYEQLVHSGEVDPEPGDEWMVNDTSEAEERLVVA